MQISIPWNVADTETYQFFKLTPDGDAVLVGNLIVRNGYESDSPQGYEEGMLKNGYVEIPKGFVLVRHSTYPHGVEIFTGPGAQLQLPQADLYADLTDEQLLALAAAKSLKPFARPKFADEVYLGLAEKGFMNKGKAITVAGRNALEDATVRARLKGLCEKTKLKYYSMLQSYY